MKNQDQDIKIFKDGGLNLDDAIEDLAANEYLDAYNIKLSGVSDSESGYVTNVEATTLITYTLPAGINKAIGSESFESIRKIIDFTYNSNGYHRINETDFDTSIRTKLFENKTDSAGIDILPLTPTSYVKNIKLIEDIYVSFLSSNRTPSIFNLNRLRSGGYGILTQDDISLIKGQPLKPISVLYQDDLSVSSNLLSKNLVQFRYQLIYLDNEPSAWSTISRREIPSGLQTSQTDVTKDNNLRLALDAGTNRVKQIRVAYISNEETLWKEIKNVKRADIILLPDTDTSVSLGIEQAYNPSTNQYIFLFYNIGAYLPIDVLETDQDYDHVPLASEALEVANGNVLLLGNNTENYEIPTTVITSAVSYVDSGIVVTNTNTNALSIANRYDTIKKPFAAISSVGFSRRGVYRVFFKGVPHTGDIITIREKQFRDGADIVSHQLLVTAATDGDILATLILFGNTAFNNGYGGYSVYYNTISLEYEFTFTTRDRYKYLDSNVFISLVSQANFTSKRSIKLNSSYEGALFYFDKYGRYFPPVKMKSLILNNSKINTDSYGITNGNIPVITWAISGTPPIGATTYQTGLTKNLTHLNWVDINAKIAQNKGVWNASTNSPSLITPFPTSKIGDYYQVSQGGSVDLGNGVIIYGLGDYIIYNGKSFDRILFSYIQANKGGIFDLSNTSYVTFYIGSLNRFNKANYSSIVNYSFSEGDRCSIYYTNNAGIKTYFNNPAIETEIVGYDVFFNILRVRKPVGFDPTIYVEQELLLELYTPKKNVTGENLIYELGKSYTITNGVHDVLTDIITEADCFIKTRQYLNANDYANPNTYLVEADSFSDFYVSNYYSYGRPHLYDSLAKQNIKKADIRFSNAINTALNINLIGKFYIENDKVYDYTKGSIQYLVQRGNMIICLQEIEFGYIPVLQSILEDQIGQQNVAISQQLLNNIRYPDNNQAGVGLAWESIAYFKGNLYFIDPLRSEPCRIGYNGLTYLKGKMSKFFKRTIQNNYRLGRKYIGWINTFDEDYVLSVQYDGDIVNQISFDPNNWVYQDSYTLPQTYTILADTNGTGVITGNQTTFTPTNNYVGLANELIGFSGNSKNLDIQVIAGNTSVDQFYFLSITNATQTTLYISNTILVNFPNIPVAISIVGGEWSKDNGVTWQSTAGTVIGGDAVSVRQTSSSSAGTATNTTLTINDKSATYTVTTTAASIGNQKQSSTIQKNNCTAGFAGTFVTYTVAANTYFASTQTAANNLALADIAANGQTYANTNGACQSTSLASTLLVDYFDTDQNSDLIMYCPTTGVTLINQIVSNRQVAGVGKYFIPAGQTDAASSYLISGNDIIQTTLKRRFGINVAKYIQDNPSIDTFQFVLQGRTSDAAKTVTGAYALRTVNQGYLYMGGSEGTYVPTVVGSSGSTTSWSNTIQTGGDGTVGIGIGAVILRLTYVVSTNTLTQSNT